MDEVIQKIEELSPSDLRWEEEVEQASVKLAEETMWDDLSFVGDAAAVGTILMGAFPCHRALELQMEVAAKDKAKAKARSNEADGLVGSASGAVV